jgi:hypothetical protein
MGAEATATMTMITAMAVTRRRKKRRWEMKRRKVNRGGKQKRRRMRRIRQTPQNPAKYWSLGLRLGLRREFQPQIPCLFARVAFIPLNITSATGKLACG